MCKITVTYDAKKRDQIKKDLGRDGISLQDAMRLYLDFLAIKPEFAKGLAKEFSSILEDEEDARAAEEAEKRLLAGDVETFTLDEVRKHLNL